MLSILRNAIACTLLLPMTVLADAGDIDTSFDKGVDNYVSASAVQTDGKIVIGGMFQKVDGIIRYKIARLNSDGASDASFGPTAPPVYDPVVGIIRQADDKLLVSMSIDNSPTNKFRRLNANGTQDTSFNPTLADSTGYDGRVFSFALQTDGKIVISGLLTAVNGVARNRIARLNSDGTLDASFNPTFTDSDRYSIYRVTLQANGKIIITGNFTAVNGTARNYIARLNADGTLDASFDPGSGLVNNSISATVPQTDGKILIGGAFTAYDGVSRNHIARLNTDGTLDTSFDPGSGANNNVDHIVLQADGKILIVGTFTTVNGTVRNSIARLNSDGVLDGSFNPGSGLGNYYPVALNGYIGTVSVQLDGKIIIGGGFKSYNGFTRNYIVRIHSGDTDSDGIEDAADQFPNDSDNDGMPNTWETTYGFNPLLNDANADFDGDGISNLQEYNNGTDPTVVDVISKTKNDYNNDGIAGWIWKGQSNGHETESQIWQLSFPLYSANWAIPTRSYPPQFSDQANWDIVTTGDFNGDDDADILWRNNATAEWKVWQMQDGTRAAQNDLADFDLAHEWQVIGAGDTDKDGDDDVILNNPATGEVLVWAMQNHAIAGSHNIGTKAGYTLNRIGDFNKDGDVDLLFRQNGSDVLVTWEIETNAFVQERTLSSTGAGYNPVCAGDFDKDGDDDIMFINSAMQQEKWFVMENYSRTQKVGALNTGFSFLGCGDYDGDGDADSLWQRTSDDKVRAVLQEGYGVGKQTVYTNPFGGSNGFTYRGNNN